MATYYQTYDSPIGRLSLTGDHQFLCGVDFEQTPQRHWINKETPVLRRAKKQLQEYFQGKRKSFDLPLKLNGTEFQKKVWKTLASIPFGRTATYKQQAERLHSPAATRAVGRANGMNPICIVLPCHRVIGKNGMLTGYSAGLDRKEFLLKLEGVNLIRSPRS